MQRISGTPFICRECRRSSTSRLFSSSAPLHNSNPPLPSLPISPPAAGYALLRTRRLLSISGPDSTKYLQGAITTSITSSVHPTSGLYTSFLNAQGRLLNDVFIYPFRETEGKYKDAEAWLVEVDAKEVQSLAKHINRYRLRSKFVVRVLAEGERGVWSVWDEGSEGWTRHGLGGSSAKRREEGSETGCLDGRAPGMGRREILPAGRKPEAEMEEVEEIGYRVRRYLKGVPEGQDELIREVALPQESCMDFMGGIDYRKGCYVGQELTIRTHHTGVVRKRVLPVMLYGKHDQEPEALEYIPTKEGTAERVPREAGITRDGKKGRSAGKWLTGVGNIGLGLCRLETMTGVVVQGEAGGYKEGDQFKIEWGEGDDKETAMVKAFVPSWHLYK